MADVSNDHETTEHEVSYLVTERDFVSLLIDLYRERPTLWKTKHPQYLDKATRAKALQEIVNELQVYKPDYDEDKVKKKINVLRTNFNKMRHKFLMNKKAGVTMKPNLWYYNQLLFLTERGHPTNVTRASSSFHSDGHETEQELDQSGEVSDSNRQEEKQEEKYFPQGHDYEESEPDPPATTKRPTRSYKNVAIKRRKVNHEPKEEEKQPEEKKQPEEETPAHEQYMTITTTYYKKPETKEDLLAKNWAMTLKKLTPTQRMYAEKIIHDVLFEAQLGNLTKDGVSFCPSF